MKWTDLQLRAHYKSVYFYDGLRQYRYGNWFERFWFTERIRKVSQDLLGCHRILEVGCGTGAITEGISNCLPFAEITATDISRRAIDTCKAYFPYSRVSYEVADAFNLPYKDGFFDAVVGIEVLEHVIDHEAMLKELARVLRPGGLLIINCPWKFHPVWVLGFVRKAISSESKEHYESGNVHAEPVHFSFTCSDLIERMPRNIRHIRDELTAFGVSLHFLAEKVE